MPTIRDVLADPVAYGLDNALFAAKPLAGLDAECLVLDPNDVEDDADDEPLAAKEAGLQYILMMNDVNGIISNLRQQAIEPDDDLRLRALQFYLARDAYISV